MACCRQMDELLTHELNNQETVIGFDAEEGWSCWADHRGGLDKIKYCPWCAAALPANGKWPAKKDEAREIARDMPKNLLRALIFGGLLLLIICGVYFYGVHEGVKREYVQVSCGEQASAPSWPWLSPRLALTYGQQLTLEHKLQVLEGVHAKACGLGSHAVVTRYADGDTRRRCERGAGPTVEASVGPTDAGSEHTVFSPKKLYDARFSWLRLPNGQACVALQAGVLEVAPPDRCAKAGRP